MNKVRFTHQGEGHIKVKVKISTSLIFYVAHILCKRGGLHLTETHSC